MVLLLAASLSVGASAAAGACGSSSPSVPAGSTPFALPGSWQYGATCTAGEYVIYEEGSSCPTGELDYVLCVGGKWADSYCAKAPPSSFNCNEASQSCVDSGTGSGSGATGSGSGTTGTGSGTSGGDSGTSPIDGGVDATLLTDGGVDAGFDAGEDFDAGDFDADDDAGFDAGDTDAF